MKPRGGVGLPFSPPHLQKRRYQYLNIKNVREQSELQQYLLRTPAKRTQKGPLKYLLPLIMQSTSDYLIRLADYERECQSRAQIAIKSIEIVNTAITSAVTAIVFEQSKRPNITRKIARLARKRDFQANKAITATEKDNALQLEYDAEAPDKIVPVQDYTRKNSYLIGDTNLKSTFSLIAVQLYLDSLSNAGNIRTIDISGQGLGDKMVMKLLNQVQGSSVVELILSSNKITDESLFRLSMVLPSLKSLANLNLSSNNFKDNGVQAIFGPNVFPISLKHIDLSTNHLGLISAYYIGSIFALAEGVVPDIRNQLDISSLFLGGNHIHGQSLEFVRVLMSFLCRNRAPLGLKSLSLPSSGLESEGLSSVSAFIACSRSIAFMNISNNSFLNEKSKAFCQSALLANKSLQHISVGKCNLTAIERDAFQSNRALGSTLSWRDRTSLSFQVGREFSKCAEARHTVEVNEFNLWSRAKPPEWPNSMYLTDDPPLPCIYLIPLDSKNVPALIKLAVRHLNEVYNGLIYIEQVLAKCYLDDRQINGMMLHSSLIGVQKAGLTSRELRLREDKMGEVKLQLLDYKHDSTTDGVVNPESMSMMIEDLLATVVHQETAVARDISLWYTKKLQKKERTPKDDAVSRRVSSATVACSTISSKYGQSQRGSVTPLQPPPPPKISENDIPYYSYLGDAAVYVYYMCVVRHLEHDEEVRAMNRKEKLKHKKKPNLKDVALSADGGDVPPGPPGRDNSISSVASKRSLRSSRSPNAGMNRIGSMHAPSADDVQSALLGDDSVPGSRRTSGVDRKDSAGSMTGGGGAGVGGGFRQSFAEADRDLFKKLLNLDLGKEEGSRAVLSNSRTNQSKMVFEPSVLSVPDLGPDSEHDLISFYLEEECPRCRDNMMDLRTIDCTERAIVAIDRVRMSFAERLQRRKLNVL